MSAKPTFVMVPGNFVPANYYYEAAKLLESRGFSTKLVSIPSTGSSLPLASNEPDIVAVQTVLDSLLEEGKDIIVVAHSYGSTPACEAIKGLSFEEGNKVEKPGGVIKLILVAAWLLSEGENPPTVIARNNVESSWLRFERGSFYCDDALGSLFTDTSPEATAYWAKEVTHSDIAAFATPLKYEAWRHIPTTYLLCEQDHCLPTFVQDEMVEKVKGKLKVGENPKRTHAYVEHAR